MIAQIILASFIAAAPQYEVPCTTTVEAAAPVAVETPCTTTAEAAAPAVETPCETPTAAPVATAEPTPSGYDAAPVASPTGGIYSSAESTSLSLLGGLLALAFAL